MKKSIALYPLLGLLCGLLHSYPASAGISFPVEALIGSFEGDLVLGRDDMKLAFTFAESDSGFSARLTSNGLGIYGMPADTVMVEDDDLTIRIPRLDLEFTGTIRLDDAGKAVTRIDGDWFQHSELVPLILYPVEEPTF